MQALRDPPSRPRAGLRPAQLARGPNATWRPWPAPPTMPSPTARSWPTTPAAPSRRSSPGHVAAWDLTQVYDIAHNMGKIEEHVVDGERLRLCVHRKGATRAFGPGFAGLPEEYRELGQPVLVPGSMGTASWVLLGTEGSMSQSFGSTCHGAGRVMSRHQAKRSIRGEQLRSELEAQGVRIRAGSLARPGGGGAQAYKEVDAVVEVVVQAGIALKVARLRPVVVIKG